MHLKVFILFLSFECSGYCEPYYGARDGIHVQLRVLARLRVTHKKTAWGQEDSNQLQSAIAQIERFACAPDDSSSNWLEKSSSSDASGLATCSTPPVP